MTLSHWANTVVDEKHAAVMRWVTTTVGETDSQIDVSRLLAADVLTPQVANFLVFDLNGSTLQLEGAPTLADLHLPLDVISRNLRTAYERTVSYLVTPETFLADFLASIEGVTLDDTFNNKLAIFQDHEYFPVLLKAWAEHCRETGAGFVTRTDFVIKLQDIDMLILRHATISTLVDLLDPIYDLVRNRSSDPALPGSELARFFEDKGLAAPAREFEVRATDELKLRDAVKVLSEMIGTTVTSTDEPMPIAEEELPSYPETHYDAFLQDLHEAGVDIREPNETNRSYPPLELFIDEKLKERTITDIFRGREDEYKRFVKSLNASRDLNKAILNLETALKLQKFDTKSKLARRLREATAYRFNHHQ